MCLPSIKIFLKQAFTFIRTRNGEPVNIDGSHIKGSDKPDTEGWAKLVIEAAEPDDSGDYVLTATNSEGKATSKAPMEVIGESSFLEGFSKPQC